jgi:ABC-type multidrug transport system fused ATPase/permease subunit
MLYKNILILAPELKGMLLRAAALSFFIELIKLTPPWVIKIVLDLLAGENPSHAFLAFTLAAMLVASLVTTVLEDRFISLICKNVFTVQANVLKKVHARVLKLDMNYHESNPSGEIVHLMNNGSTKLMELLFYLQDQFLGASIQIILTSCVLIYVHPWAGLTFFIFMPITIVLSLWSAKKLQPYRKKYHDTFRQATWEMNQSILNIRTVKDFVQESKEKKKYNQLLDQYLHLADERINFENSHIRTRDTILGFGRFFVLSYSVYLVLQGEMTHGTLVLFSTLSEKVIASLYRLGRLYSLLGDAMESIQQFCELFQTKPKIVEKDAPLSLPHLQGTITFNNASFSYDTNSSVLKDISLTIPEKKFCAIVGRSGAGKSTFVKLLLRHYDVTAGSILIDGYDIRDFKISDYRKKIAVVAQDVEVFDSSVADNIAYGVNASQEEIEVAAKKAFAHDFIRGLPEAYQTRVGERGIKLSGGQRQRLGIARALITKPAVLIFDEATSSLDTESENMIQNAIHDISHLQTMIVIAHRLSTIRRADMVVVLDDGRIVECGSYDALISKGGLFAEMVSLQKLGELRE